MSGKKWGDSRGAMRRRWGLVRKGANGQAELGSVSDSANCRLGTLDESLGFLKQQFHYLQNEDRMTNLRIKLG